MIEEVVSISWRVKACGCSLQYHRRSQRSSLDSQFKYLLAAYQGKHDNAQRQHRHHGAHYARWRGVRD